jgi:hypothetical protein
MIIFKKFCSADVYFSMFKCNTESGKTMHWHRGSRGILCNIAIEQFFLCGGVSRKGKHRQVTAAQQDKERAFFIE